MTTTYLPASFGEAIAAIAEGKHVDFKMSDRPETQWRAFTEDTWVRLADTPKYIWRIRAQDEQAQRIAQLQAELDRVLIQFGMLRSERDYMLRRIGDLEIELKVARAKKIPGLRRFFGG